MVRGLSSLGCAHNHHPFRILPLEKAFMNRSNLEKEHA